ncbi:hypothetical protein PFISCL1PPCAC_2585, partial [Pristionchus fissidentatus]
TRMIIREGIQMPKKSTGHLKHDEKIWLNSCRLCGIKDSVTGKNWCDKCCGQLSIKVGDPIDTHENLTKVLTFRAIMMNEKCRQVKMDHRLLDQKISLDMEKLIEEGAHLYELVAICRILGIERELTKKSYKNDKYRMKWWEGSLHTSLLLAMRTDGD